MRGARRRGRGALVPALLWATALQPGAAEGADWPHWRGPTRSSVSQETGWLAQWPPTESWRTSVGPGFSSVVTRDGRLYTMGYDIDGGQDVVYCLDAVNGTQMWASAYVCGEGSDGGYTGPRATPEVDGDRLYTFSRLGEVRCWNRFTGSNVWTTAISCTIPSWALTGSPFVEGDIVYVHAGAKGVALNKHTGGTAWSNSGGKAGRSSPFAFTYNSQRLIGLYSADIGFVAVNAATGAEAMRYTKANADYNCADPIVYQGDKVFLSCGRATWCGLIQMGSGSLGSVWTSNSSMLNLYNTSLLWDGYLYGVNSSGYLRCLSLSDNVVKWTQTGLSLGEGNLIAADGKLIVLGLDGRLRVVKAQSTGYSTEGRALYTIAGFSGQGRPLVVLSNGRIYCRSEAGTLVCLKVGDVPEVTNGGGATAVTRESAELAGNLVSAGSTAAQAWFCWGEADGGQSLAAWETVVPLGVCPAGSLSHTVTGLTAGTSYRYTTCASNSVGVDWAPASAHFATPPALGLSVSVAPTNGLTPLSVQFTSDPSGGTAYTFAWNFGDGGASAAQNPVHVYTNSGAFTAMLTVDDGLDAITGAVEVVVAADTDHDGMADAWEMQYFLTLDRDGSGDFDQDGLSDRAEHDDGTDPTRKGPAWWYARGVLDAGAAVTNDFAAANQGQVKWIALQARQAIVAAHGAAPPEVEALVGGFSSSNNYEAVNVGQVKSVARPFYDWLGSLDGVTNYPWTGAAATNDYAPANAGQVKAVFGFEIR